MRHRRDEATMIDPVTGAVTVPVGIVGFSRSPKPSSPSSADDDDEEDWRKNV